MVMDYRLVAPLGASRASTVANRIPLSALSGAWWLLGEPVTLPMLLAGVLILGSVAVGRRPAR